MYSLKFDFLVACQPDELGVSGDPRMSSQGTYHTVPNGRVCYNGTTADSTAKYTCDSSGNETVATRTCGSDGRWEGDTPACRKIITETTFLR